MRHFYVLFFVFIFIPTVCAAPLVNTVSRSDTTLSIDGTGFGTKSPAAPILWDNFESGSASADWTTVDANWTVYSGSGQVTNSSYCLRADLSGVLSVDLRKDFNIGLGDTMYVSMDRRWDFDVQPLNLKFLRMHEYTAVEGEIGSGSFAWNYLPESGDIEEFFCRTSISPHVDPLNPTSVYSGPVPNAYYPDYNDWLSEEFFVKMPDNMNDCDSEMGYRVGNQYEYFPTNRCLANTGTNLPYSSLFIDNFGKPSGIGTAHTCDDSPYSTYEFCNTSGDCSCYVPGSYVWVDNVYIDDTWSRVMVGNASTFESCTILEPQIPITWANGTDITATVNTGKLGESVTGLYLYVVDSTGAVSDQDTETAGTQGYLIQAQTQTQYSRSSGQVSSGGKSR